MRQSKKSIEMHSLGHFFSSNICLITLWKIYTISLQFSDEFKNRSKRDACFWTLFCFCPERKNVIRYGSSLIACDAKFIPVKKSDFDLVSFERMNFAGVDKGLVTLDSCCHLDYTTVHKTLYHSLSRPLPSFHYLSPSLSLSISLSPYYSLYLSIYPWEIYSLALFVTMI